nr:hypothetical protein HUO10_003592 [Paraburkholderia busanensis]
MPVKVARLDGLCVRVRHHLDLPICSNPDGLKRSHQCAADRGGVCLVSGYESGKAYYLFRCSEGHEWETQDAKIVRGAWCPQCQYQALRFGIGMMRTIASERRGRCLSTTYHTTSTLLKWECQQGHRWRTLPSVMVRGYRCATCKRESLKLGIELMRNIAAERGGLCVSDVYVNSSTRLEWECSRGHRWLATPNTIRNGHWCARCRFIAITTNPKDAAQAAARSSATMIGTTRCNRSSTRLRVCLGNAGNDMPRCGYSSGSRPFMAALLLCSLLLVSVRIAKRLRGYRQVKCFDFS